MKTCTSVYKHRVWKKHQISWIADESDDRSESRTRIALDQSLELQNLANSILFGAVDAISSKKKDH